MVIQSRAASAALLPALQHVRRPTSGKAPFFSTTLSRDVEMRSAVRFSISSARRGKVQFGRSDTPGANRNGRAVREAENQAGRRAEGQRPIVRWAAN